jgi:hypothetical protein
MAVAFEGSVAAAVDFGGGLGTTISVSPPSGLAAGELWVAATYQTVDGGFGVGPVAVESGWNNIGAYEYRAGVPQDMVGRAQYKVAGASESAVALDCQNAVHYDCVAVSFAFSGQNATPLGDVVVETGIAGGNSVQTFSPSNLNIDNAGSMAVSLLGYVQTDLPELLVDQPDGMTRFDGGATSPVGARIFGAYQAVNAGTYNPGNWTIEADITGFAQWLSGVTFEVQPTASGVAPRIITPIAPISFGGARRI